MAKDRESSKPSHAHPEKEERKKKKRSDEDGVHKSSSDKKEKKEKKAKREALAEKALNEIHTATAPAPAPVEAKSDDEEEVAEAEAKSKQVLRPAAALVPFANPLADEKVAKKVFKSVKKGMYYPQQHNYVARHPRS